MDKARQGKANQGVEDGMDPFQILRARWRGKVAMWPVGKKAKEICRKRWKFEIKAENTGDGSQAASVELGE